jgi:hypothetical protein
MEREDLYEAAVRAILDLCDEADDAATNQDFLDFGGRVETADIRKAIKEALLMDQEEAP